MVDSDLCAPATKFLNLTKAELLQIALSRGEGKLAKSDALSDNARVY